MTKWVYILFLVSIFQSCELKETKNENNINKTKINSKSVLSIKLIGEWGIYVTNYNGASEMCNVCPSIEFKIDNTAKIKLPNGENENYNWKTDGNSIVITAERKNANNYLSDKTYKMEFKQKDDFIELTLKLKEIEYILRK